VSIGHILRDIGDFTIFGHLDLLPFLKFSINHNLIVVALRLYPIHLPEKFRIREKLSTIGRAYPAASLGNGSNTIALSLCGS
jgi:hypothetical protein